MTLVESVEQLEAIYGQPGEASIVKEADRITPEYRAYIEASPFAVLATAGSGPGAVVAGEVVATVVAQLGP